MSRKTNGTDRKIEKMIDKPTVSASSQPVYFLSFDIENFRCFGPKQILNLSTRDGRTAQWTVILGENGVGKTTLLRCLADFEPVEDAWEQPSRETRPAQNLDFLFINEAFQDPADYVFRYARPKAFSFASFYTMLGHAVKEDGDKSNKPVFAAQYGLASFRERGASPITDTRISVGIKNSYSYSTMPGNIILTKMVCYGYGASRRMGKSNLSEKREGDNCASLFNDDAELLNAEEWLLQADYAASRASTHQHRAVNQRDRIKELLIRLLPDVEDIRIAEGEGSVSVPKVEFKTPYGWVNIQNLSLGYRALITWMVDLASRLFDRYPDSPDPLAEPAVVLVDEIDLHLHPRWQRTLMQFLSDIFKQTQFIVTAHSPLVVQAADENANIVLLRREGDHVVIENDVKTIRGWRVDQILTSDLFGLETARPPQYDEAIKERTALLSKGKLTRRDEARLAELEKQIDELPTGESPSDMEAMDIIRQAAELLKAK